MPTFEFECKECECVFEELVLSGEVCPTDCPNCEAQDALKKIISLPAMGKVTLTGQEWKDKMATDSAKDQVRAMKDENFLANLVGEIKYETKTKAVEKDAQNRPKIKRNNKK